MNLFGEIKQTEQEIKFTQVVFKEIQNMISHQFKLRKGFEVDVGMYGSTFNGLALRGSSDLDISVKIITPHELNFNILFKVVSKELRHPKEDSFKSDIVNFVNPVCFCATFGEILNMVVEKKDDPS
jgi:DNA polymerase sigma